MPYRSWCPICVKGKGKATPHKLAESHQEVGVTVVSIDNVYLRDVDVDPVTGEAMEDVDGELMDPETGQKLQPILVMYDARTKGIYAQSVQHKGAFSRRL